MCCEKSFYLCKNLVFLDYTKKGDYICSLNGERCSCQGVESNCSAYGEDQEE